MRTCVGTEEKKSPLHNFSPSTLSGLTKASESGTNTAHADGSNLWIVVSVVHTQTHTRTHTVSSGNSTSILAGKKLELFLIPNSRVGKNLLVVQLCGAQISNGGDGGNLRSSVINETPRGVFQLPAWGDLRREKRKKKEPTLNPIQSDSGLRTRIQKTNPEIPPQKKLLSVPKDCVR